MSLNDQTELDSLKKARAETQEELRLLQEELARSRSGTQRRSRGVQRELANLRTENQVLRTRLQKLSDISNAIASEFDLRKLLQDVIYAACELSDANYGALGIFDPDGQIEQFITHGLGDEERALIGALPQGLGILGVLQEREHPLRLANLAQHPRSVGFPANHPPMRSFLGVPIRLSGENLGNIYLTEKQGNSEFSPDDEWLLSLFADQAAVAIHNAHLRRQLEETSAASDRTAEDATSRWSELQTIVDISPVAVFVFDTDGRAVLLNQEGQRVMGLPRASMGSIEQYFQAAVRKRVDGSAYAIEDLPIVRALQRGEIVRAEEVRLEFSDGHSMPTLFSAAPIRDNEGKVTAAVAVIQDITPLEELEKLRTEFVGMIGHELRTPLAVIKGAAATIVGSKRAWEASEATELFEIIDEQADRLRDLVDNLLDIGRIESGTLSVRPEATDLLSLISEAVKTFQRARGAHVVEIETEDVERMPRVSADRHRIGQVLNNLLVNAAKFAPQDRPICIRVSEGDVYVTVSVEDQGRGIPPDKLPHLFRKFSQVHKQESRLEGTGLGLAICKGIVEAHGGRIWAESGGEGRGSAFTFTLLLAEETSEQTELPQPQSGLLTPTARTKPKILAVDDEVRLLRIVERILSEAAYEVVTTSDPAQLQALIKIEEPDLVLLDLRLPGISGFDLLAQIRQISGIPVIFLTGNDNEQDTVRALNSGADDYITKPFTPSELLARIEASLRRRMSTRAPQRPPFLLHDLRVDFESRIVVVADKTVALTGTEYKILEQLVTNAGRTLTHDQLLERVWGPEYGGETSLLRSLIRNLRRKLGDDPRQARYIHTERDVGYRLGG